MSGYRDDDDAYCGPTSFAEMEAMQEAQEQAWYINSLTYHLTAMIRNVFNSDLPDKKAALTSLIAEYNERIQAPPEKKQKMSFASVFSKLFPKSRDEDGVSYQAKHYADVPDANDPDTWGLLLADANGRFAGERIQRAIHALQENLKGESRVNLDQIIDRIESAIDASGESPSEKDSLRQSLKMVKTLGKQRYTVFKDNDGEWRWLGISTNRWEDREKEVLTHEAHVEYKEWLDAHPDKAPHKWSWHTPWTKSTHPADWWDYANGFFIWSGVLTEDEAQAELKMDGQLGMSHGFFVLARDPLNEQLITQYRTFEVSDLSIGAAANVFTDFAVLMEDSNMFATRRQYLVAKFGEDKVSKAEQSLQKGEQVLDLLQTFGKEYQGDPQVMTQAIAFFKEVMSGGASDTPMPDDEEDEEGEGKNPAAKKPAPAEGKEIEQVAATILKMIDAEGLQAVLVAMKSSLVDTAETLAEVQRDIATLKGQVAQSETQIKALAKDDVQKVADQYTAFNWGMVLDNRPTTQKNNNVGDTDSATKDNGILPVPEAAWLPAAFS